MVPPPLNGSSSNEVILALGSNLGLPPPSVNSPGYVAAFMKGDVETSYYPSGIMIVA